MWKPLPVGSVELRILPQLLESRDCTWVTLKPVVLSPVQQPLELQLQMLMTSVADEKQLQVEMLDSLRGIQVAWGWGKGTCLS